MLNSKENLEDEVDKKYKRRDKKRRPRMKVSGKSVLRLKRIIEDNK